MSDKNTNTNTDELIKGLDALKANLDTFVTKDEIDTYTKDKMTPIFEAEIKKLQDQIKAVDDKYAFDKANKVDREKAEFEFTDEVMYDGMKYKELKVDLGFEIPRSLHAMRQKVSNSVTTQNDASPTMTVNPFVVPTAPSIPAMLARRFPVGMQNLINLPSFESVTFTDADDTDASKPDPTYIGQSNKTLRIKTIKCRPKYAIEEEEDLPGYAAGVVQSIMEAYEFKKAQMVTNLLADTNSSTRQFDSGQYYTTKADNGLGTNDQILESTTELIAGVNSRYLNDAVFVVSPQSYTAIMNASSLKDNRIVVNGQDFLYGYRMFRDDNFPAVADGNLQMVFGSFSRGVAFAVKRELAIARLLEASVGDVTISARARLAFGGWHRSSLAFLHVA